MAQPTSLPDAAAQKQAAIEVFAQYEPTLYEAYLEMMLEWLAAVKTAMFAGGVARLGLVPDPMKVFSQTPKWHTLTAQYSEKVAEEVLSAPYKDLFADGTLFESRPFVRNWIAARENRLNRVPDEVFGAVSKIIDSATVNGASIPDVAEQVGQLFDATDVPKWQSRARTVARTEVVGAYNGGLHDAFAMIVANDPDTTYVKRWLATEDHRTRPDHREADGQVVPFAQPFDVGAHPMMYPHDPDGPPHEVINCVVGSTHVDWPGQLIQGATRRRHVGTLVQLRTAEGHDLTITPNHPVLTPKGYVPAGLLRPGQYVMGTVKTAGPPADAGSPEVGDVPSSAEQVYRALSQAGEPQRVVGSRMDFHGDGSDAEVQVVGADGYLPRDANTKRVRQAQKLLLLGPDSRERPLSGLGGAVVARVPLSDWPGGRTAPRLVSRLGVRPPLGEGQASHSKPVSLAATADFQAQLRETPDDGRTAEADFPAHLQYALAAGMAPCEIVQVERLTGDHEVFNLSTSDHWYTANGIATHNCRCTLLLEIKNEPTEMGNRQYLGGSVTLSKTSRGSWSWQDTSRGTLMQAACTDGQFCMQTHKPGLCKGQKRGQTEPGAQDATKATPAKKAQIAVSGLNNAIAQAQAVAAQNAVTNPKLAAMAKRAISGYRRALAPHQQTLKDAGRANAQGKRQGDRDTREQDTLDRRSQQHRETLKRRAERILARRAEKAKLAKMTPKQRTAYRKGKAAKAAAQREAQENQTLKEASKG